MTVRQFLAISAKTTEDKIHAACGNAGGTTPHVVLVIDLTKYIVQKQVTKNESHNEQIVKRCTQATQFDISAKHAALKSSSMDTNQNVHVYIYYIDTIHTKKIYIIDAGFLCVLPNVQLFTTQMLTATQSIPHAITMETVSLPEAPQHPVPAFQLPHPMGVTAECPHGMVNIERMSLVLKTLCVFLAPMHDTVPAGASLYSLDSDTLGDVTVAEEQAAIVVLIASISGNPKNADILSAMFKSLLQKCHACDATFHERMRAANPHYEYSRSIDMMANMADVAINTLSRHYASPDVRVGISAAITFIRFLVIEEEEEDIDDD